MKSDYHMHTAFSHDSESLPEDMIKGALAKGLNTICFTDHYDKDYFEWGKESIFDIDEYFQTLLPLKEKYSSQIKVCIGVEIGLQPHLGKAFDEFVAAYPFDFVIGSAHVLQGLDLAVSNLFHDKTDHEVYQMMFDEMLEEIKTTTQFDVLGHIDYMVRYGKNKAKDYSYHKFKEQIDSILNHLIDHQKGIELNTAGLKYGLPFAHPHPDILKRYRELGGEIITVGADGHRPEHIAYDFHKAVDILKSCGFKYYTEFEQRTPVFKQDRKSVV